MSDSSHLHNNTFLSRVFAATSKSTADPPLLNDDNSSIHDINQNNGLDLDDPLNLSNHKHFINRQSQQGENGDNNTTSYSDTSNKAKYLSKLAINVHSESEESSDNESAEETNSKDRIGDIKLHDSPQLVPLNENKRKLMRQLESEMGVDDNDYDDFLYHNDTDHDSVLLEEGRYIPSLGRISERERPNMFRQLEQSVMGQIRDNDLNMNISQIGQKAKSLANKAFTQLPAAFNNENSILQPPPNFLSYPRNYDQQNNESISDDNRPNTERIYQQIFNARKLPPRERALWMWANITNLDIFLQDVYDYYLGNGWYCIAMQRTLDLLIVIFVIWLSTFMGNCIDYSKLMNGTSNKLLDVYVSKCFTKTSFAQKIFFTILGAILILRVKHTWEELCDLKEIQLFYTHLLNIDDDELQTINWPQIVKKIMILKEQHTNAVVSLIDQDAPSINKSKASYDLKSKARLNAHDIANRLMRKDNYMIAIFNKNILNKALTVPIFNTYFLTKTLEWNLNLCITDYMFTKEGQLKPAILVQNNRMALANGLRKRFKLAGLLSIILTPFLVVYFVLYFFLKLFYDFKTNPGLLNAREYSPYAKWKMREFNELPHLFDQRLKFSVEGADEYLEQFPKEKINIIMKFLSFISGSLLTVLVIMTIVDHENFLNFELSEGRTVLFYISTLGAIFTVCKNNISSSTYVFDPEASLKYVSQFTHYLPKSWDGRYHSISVKTEFCQLYNLKLVLIGKEICSLILLPWMLYISLPSSSEKIIDFFRDFSVHVDGLGHVCSFAIFNLNQEERSDKVSGFKPTQIGETKSVRYRFDRNHNHLKKVNDEANDKNDTVNKLKTENDPDEIANEEYYADNDDKMVKSYIHFLESYGGANKLGKTNDLNQPPYPNNSNRGKHPKNDLRKSILRTNYHERLEETNAGLLSNDTEQYLNGLTKSIMLGDDLQRDYNIPQINTKNKEGQENIEDSAVGVIGLLNQIYRHKD